MSAVISPERTLPENVKDWTDPECKAYRIGWRDGRKEGIRVGPGLSKAARARTASLGDAECELRYDFDPGCAANFNVERNPHDARDAKVTLTEVLINGDWVSADYFDKKWTANAESDLLEAITDELRERDLL